MKKICTGAFVVALAFGATSVFAISTSGTLGAGTSTAVSTTDCPVLESAVNIGLSNKVHGAYVCHEATSAIPTRIGLGTCHEAGLAKARDIICTRTFTNGVDDTGGYDYAPSACSASNFPAGAAATSVNVKGVSMFTADTASGGSTGNSTLDDVCTAGLVQSEIETKWPAQ